MKMVIRKLIVCFFMVFCALGLTGCGYTSDEPCIWCGSTATPTKCFTTSTGKEVYYCEKDSTTCWLCGKNATEHYTNGFEVETFVCSECYKDVLSEMKK